jgi:hypothetical protein
MFQLPQRLNFIAGQAAVKLDKCQNPPRIRARTGQGSPGRLFAGV